MRNNTTDVAKWMGRLLLTLCLVVSSAAAVLAFDVSGTVVNLTTSTGRIYLRVKSVGNNGSPVAGLSIPDGTTVYTIRGLPDTGGSYVVSAFLDATGDGVQHANDPVGSSLPFNFPSSTGVNVTLDSPAPAVVLLPPGNASVTYGTDNAAIFFDHPRDNNGNEIATSYKVYWIAKTSPDPNPGPLNFSGSSPVMTSATKEVFIAYNLTNPSTYNFSVTASLNGTETDPVIASNTPATGTTYTVEGTVITTGISLSGGNHLVAILLNGSTGTLFADAIANPSDSQAITFSGVPAGTYVLYSILDMNDNGAIDLGDIADTEIGVPVVVTDNVTGVTATLVAADSKPYVKTAHHKSSGTSLYSLTLAADVQMKRPVNVSVSGPQIPLRDLGLFDGRSSTFGTSQNVSLRPALTPTPDSYSFAIEYSSGSGATPLTASVTGIVDHFATPLSPIGIIAYPPPSPFQFSWAQPSPAPGYPYTYNFWLNNPNNFFNSDSFQNMASSTTSVSLTSDQFTAQAGVDYFWIVTLQDSYGNLGESSANFTTGGSSISGKVTSDGVHGIANTYAVLLNSVSNVPVNGIPATLTDSTSGVYVINNVPPGSYKVYFSAGPGYQDDVSQVQFVSIGVNPTNINAVLTAVPNTGTIFGQVVNAATGQAIPYALVTLLNTSNSSLGPAFTTTSNGEFNIGKINPGSYKLQVSATGYQGGILTTMYTVFSGVATPAPISLPPIVIPPTVTYTSKVTDSKSDPISGALVELVGISTTATTDVNGIFSITVPSQTDFYLRISKTPTYVTSNSSIMNLNKDTNSSDRPHTLYTIIPDEVGGWYTQASITHSANTGTIAGKVASASNPLMTLPGVTLKASDGTTDYPVCVVDINNAILCGTLLAPLTTKANGKYFVFNVPAGKQVTITATKGGYSTNNNSRIFQVAADSVSSGRITISNGGNSYTGKLVDTATIPVAVPGITVSLFTDSGNANSGQLTTDANGVFTVADMLAGTPYYIRFNGAAAAPGWKATVPTRLSTVTWTGPTAPTPCIPPPSSLTGVSRQQMQSSPGR